MDIEKEKERLANLSEEEKKIINQKLEMINLMESTITPLATTWTHLPGTFTIYTQLAINYCVPASVQSILTYINGTSSSQSDIATAIGTTANGSYFTNMVTYLNSMQSKNYYTVIFNETQPIMANALYTAVSSLKVPPVVGIRTNSITWRYDTAGHSVLVNAAQDDKTNFQIADPLINFIGLDNPYYIRPTALIYTVHTTVQNLGLAF